MHKLEGHKNPRGFSHAIYTLTADYKFGDAAVAVDQDEHGFNVVFGWREQSAFGSIQFVVSHSRKSRTYKSEARAMKAAAAYLAERAERAA